MPVVDVQPGDNPRAPGKWVFGTDDGFTIEIRTDGTIGWGPSGQPSDVTLSRTGAGVLNISGTALQLNGSPIGGGGSVGFTNAWLTTGDLTLADTVGVWTLVAGGPSIAIAAAVGDIVSLHYKGLIHANSSELDIVVVDGSDNIVRASSSGSTAHGFEGDPSIAPTSSDASFRHPGLPFSFVATAGDIASGLVTFKFATRRNGGVAGTLYASSNYPLYWEAWNFGPPA